MIRVFMPVPATSSLRVVSTNAPFGAGVARMITADETALSNAAVQTGMLSPVSASVPGLDTLFTDQSAAFQTAARQTGSLKVTPTWLPETVIEVKVGRVVSAKV